LTNGHVPVELGDYIYMTKHTPKYNWCHQINEVRVWTLSEFCISLSASCWCYCWPDRGHNPPILAAWSYFTAGPFCLRCYCW